MRRNKKLVLSLIAREMNFWYINKKSVNKGTSHHGIIILDNNHSREVPFLINNKLKM